MHECPRCHGEGDIEGFGCGPNICLKPIVLPCQLCNGTGEVNAEKLEWVKRGRAMRNKRVYGKPYVTIFKAAEARGLTASEYSKMEQGITEPDK